MENLATQLDGQVLTVKITGRLDTSNAQACATELLPQLEGVQTVVFDCKDLVYISSAGLRVLIQVKKQMNHSQGDALVRHLSPEIQEVFKMTGFDTILKVE